MDREGVHRMSIPNGASCFLEEGDTGKVKQEVEHSNLGMNGAFDRRHELDDGQRNGLVLAPSFWFASVSHEKGYARR